MPIGIPRRWTNDKCANFVSMNDRRISLIPPVKHTGLRLSDRKKKAAGIPAVISSIAHLREETGVIDGIKILSRMNQKGGFDCPGCAWPDPEDPSRLGEYCENGVKAIAEEATTKRVDRDFFAQHSVEELSVWSDYELGKSGRITEPFILRKGSSHYEPIGWSEAIAHIAMHCLALAEHLLGDRIERVVLHAHEGASQRRADVVTLRLT